jgi:Terminase large subunit, T4likevirus-type, N-terminal
VDITKRETTTWPLAAKLPEITQQTAALPPALTEDPLTFARTRLNFHPDARQAEVLLSTSRRGILNCSRQWGKSTVCAAKAVHRAYTRPGSLILVASPTERQSSLFLRKAESMVRALGLTPRGDGDNSLSLLFPNRSSIVGLPGTEDTIRGFSAVSLVLIDEASRVDDAMYKALLPMLAVGNGDLWMMSTPHGRRGFFYETWTHGGESWARIKATGADCERISKDFLEEMRGALGSKWFEQEYLGEFVASEDNTFDLDLIEAALDSEVAPLLGPRVTSVWGPR